MHIIITFSLSKIESPFQNGLPVVIRFGPIGTGDEHFSMQSMLFTILFLSPLGKGSNPLKGQIALCQI